MRDWRSVLAAVKDQPAAPTYRFRGHLAPADLPRTPLLNTASAVVQDGAATIRLFDPIDSWGGEWGVSAKEFAEVLDQLGDVKQINLHVNSPGGEVFEAMAILNMLRAHPANVTSTVLGIAASSASFIASGSDEVVMARNSEFMIHDAWGLALGNAADMRKTADLLDHLSDNIASVYAEKAGGTVAGWRASMLAETWYSAQEAVDAGLADRVDAPAAEEPPADKPKAEFDLSTFVYPGRDAAPAPAAARIDDAPGADWQDRRHRMNARRAG